MEHTPGPWSIDQEATLDELFAIIGVKNCQANIECEGPSFYPENYASEKDFDKEWDREQQKLIDECNANARLIAAAPELLAACEYVVQYHRDHDSGEGELFGLDLVTTCIAAISKAKGE